jgi:hypothetical protein
MQGNTWREELAWAAGFFDGEGTFGYAGKKGCPAVQISQKDPTVLGRFKEIVGMGTVSGPRKNLTPKGRASTIHAYYISGLEPTQYIGAILWIFLSQQKRDQFARSMLQATCPTYRRKYLCKNGHQKTKENTRVTKDGKSFCRQCCLESYYRCKYGLTQAAYLEKRKATCLHGHERTPENTWITKEGGQACKACHRESSGRTYAKKRQKQPELNPALRMSPPDRAALVARLHEMRARGMSLTAMARQLQAEGSPTLSGTGQWKSGTIIAFLRRAQHASAS